MIKEAGSSGYTDGELLRMQQDAIARVKEMQERAKANVTAQEGWQGTGAAAPGEEPAAAPTGPSQETAAPPTGQAGPSGPPPGARRESGPAPPPPSGLLGGLLGGRPSSLSGIVSALGSDRLLLLALLFLLLREEEDPVLILALCYLLLFD